MIGALFSVYTNAPIYTKTALDKASFCTVNAVVFCHISSLKINPGGEVSTKGARARSQPFSILLYCALFKFYQIYRGLHVFWSDA